MGFILRTVRDGTQKSFTIKEILKLIGDRINDEIRIEGEIFRISSCVESGSSGEIEVTDWVEVQITVDEVSQSSFSVEIDTSDHDSLFLKVNNINYRYEADYHIEGTTLHWHGGFDLEPSDQVVLKYPQIIQSF